LSVKQPAKSVAVHGKRKELKSARYEERRGEKEGEVRKRRRRRRRRRKKKMGR